MSRKHYEYDGGTLTEIEDPNLSMVGFGPDEDAAFEAFLTRTHETRMMEKGYDAEGEMFAIRPGGDRSSSNTYKDAVEVWFAVEDGRFPYTFHGARDAYVVHVTSDRALVKLLSMLWQRQGRLPT